MWIQSYAGKCTGFLDLVDRAMQMFAGLDMHGNHVSTHLAEALDVSLRTFDHQVDVERLGGALLQRFHDREAKADIRHKHAIHHIDVEPVRIALVDEVDGGIEIAEVGGED